LDEGESNFAVIQEWNKAEVYAKTIALFADKFVGDRTIRTADAEPAATHKTKAPPTHKIKPLHIRHGRR
jgi:hypothetical protein